MGGGWGGLVSNASYFLSLPAFRVRGGGEVSGGGTHYM
jgi:hypothetical protein